MPSNILPTIHGLYERRYDNSKVKVAYAFWDGNCWSVGSLNRTTLGPLSEITEYPDLHWRGKYILMDTMLKRDKWVYSDSIWDNVDYSSPTKKGVYERLLPSHKLCFSLWDGKIWHIDSLTVEGASTATQFSPYQRIDWRGLIKNYSKLVANYDGTIQHPISKLAKKFLK